MTAKRFTVDDGLEDVLCWEINDKENENMTCGECVKLLNEQHETIQRYQTTLEDMLQNERTHIGQSVLKQYKEAIQNE